MDKREGGQVKGRKPHTPEQILRRLPEGDEMQNEGTTVAEVTCAFVYH